MPDVLKTERKELSDDDSDENEALPNVTPICVVKTVMCW